MATSHPPSFKSELHVTVAFVGGNRALRQTVDADMAAAPAALAFEVVGLFRSADRRLYAMSVRVSPEAAALLPPVPHVTLHVEPPYRAVHAAQACALAPDGEFEQLPLCGGAIVFCAERYAHRGNRKGEKPLGAAFTAAEGRAHEADHADCPVVWWGYLLDDVARASVLERLRQSALYSASIDDSDSGGGISAANDTPGSCCPNGRTSMS